MTSTEVRTNDNGTSFYRTSYQELRGLSRPLFLALTAYTVIPIVEVPLLGLSASAPILFLISLEVFFGSRRMKALQIRWNIICFFLFIGILLSLAGNTIFGGAEIDLSDIITLIRYAYWIIVFYTTVIIISSSRNFLNAVSYVIAAAMIVLVCLRLYEAIVFGRWGAWTNPSLLSQNSYAIQFSTFAPFVLALPFLWRGARKWLAVGAVILTFLAVAGNGSRASWVAVAGGVTIFICLVGFTQRSGVSNVGKYLAAIIGLNILIAAIVPHALLEPITDRVGTFEALDGDKSFAIRQLMIQKGQRLFEQNPIFGVGIGRFREASVVLDIPLVLAYANQDHFDEKSSHNTYISVLGETGLLGILPFGTLHLVLLFRGSVAAFRLAKHGQIWGIAIFCAYIGMSIHLWALSGLTGTAPWFIYGLVAGMIEYEWRGNHSLTMETIP